jgi:hypothetical protein
MSDYHHNSGIITGEASQRMQDSSRWRFASEETSRQARVFHDVFEAVERGGQVVDEIADSIALQHGNPRERGAVLFQIARLQKLGFLAIDAESGFPFFTDQRRVD